MASHSVQVNSPEIDLYFCHVSHKMTSPFCWLFIDLRRFTKIVCFYNVWIFAAWIWSCWENPSKSLRAVEKSQGAAEKNRKKVEANCTGFSAEFFASQLDQMFCFAKKTKVQILTTSFRSLTRIHHLLKSLGLYLQHNFGLFC